jgi:hypothetical protein
MTEFVLDTFLNGKVSQDSSKSDDIGWDSLMPSEHRKATDAPWLPACMDQVEVLEGSDEAHPQDRFLADCFDGVGGSAGFVPGSSGSRFHG